MFQRIERELSRTLTEQEKEFIEVATQFLLIPTEDKFKHLKQIETPRLKFSAISDSTLQITLADADRIAQISLNKEDDVITPTVTPDLTQLSVSANDASPQVTRHFTRLPAEKKCIIFFGGGVRHTLTPDRLIKTTHSFFTGLLNNIGETTFAVLTDGYKGNDIPSAYPATRAPHDISQHLDHARIPRYMIAPECAKSVCHQSLHATDFYGKNWGEEAPALAAAANAFVFIAPFNLITELEIILALKQKKPVVIIDINQTEEVIHHTRAKCGYVYPEGGVYSYQSPERAAEVLAQQLASIAIHQESVRANENTPPSTSQQLTLGTPLKSPVQYNVLTRVWDAQLGSAGFGTSMRRLLEESSQTSPLLARRSLQWG